MRFFILAIILVFALASHGQTRTIKGRALDRDSNDATGLIGAVIYNTTSKQLAVTDLDGNFEIEIATDSTTTIYTTYVGYNRLLTTIQPTIDSLILELSVPSQDGLDYIIGAWSHYEANQNKLDSINTLYHKYDIEIDSIFRNK
jgi:hypothetical protein